MINTICVIPARGGSTRIPRKNIRAFRGVPMIQRAIQTAMDSGLFNAVVVSTDDSEIAQLSKSLGAQVIQRPFDLCHDLVGTQEVVRHACLSMGLPNDDMVMCLYPCTPLITGKDIVQSMVALQFGGKPFVTTVDSGGNDAGAIYWGWAGVFKGGLDLEPNSTPHKIARACDINTEEDWARAEAMFDEMPGAGGNNAEN